MKKLLFIKCFTIVLFFCSCNENIEESVTGWWSIDTIYYKGYDVKNCIIGNALYLKSERESVLPVAEKRCPELISKSFEKSGTWKITKSGNPNDTIPFRLEINTSNELFNGTHQIVFYKDNVNKLLKMEIWSKELYVTCRKGLFDFDENIKLIDKLQKTSWRRRTPTD